MGSNIGLLMLHFFVCMPSGFLMLKEPVCTSRYDFEEKLIEKSVKLDVQMQILQQTVDKQLETLQSERIAMSSELSKLSNDLKEMSTQISNKQDAKNKELSLLTDTLSKEVKQNMADADTELKGELTKKIEEVDSMMKLQETQVTRMSRDLRTLANETLAEIKGLAVKPPVVFHVRTVSDTSPAVGDILKFTNTLANTDNVYDTSTGYFTAPVSGTYWFAVQICGSAANRWINYRLFVNDKQLTDTSLYAQNSFDCSSVNAVSVLSKDDRVSVKVGPNTNIGSGSVIGTGNYRWSIFSGALVN